MLSNRIIASSLIYGKVPFETALQELKKHGFTTFEMALEPDLCPHYDLLHATEKTDAEIASLIESAGMRVSDLNIGDSMRRRMTLEEIHARHMATFRLAKRLGVNKVVFAAGIVLQDSDISLVRSTMYPYFRELIKTAKDFGITLMIEAPHKMSITETPEGTRDFWENMDPDILCSFDVAHVTFGGGDVAELAERMAGRIGNVHLRDAVLGNTFVPYGTGKVDFQEMFDIVRAGGYTGTFSIEFLASDLPHADKTIQDAANLFSGMRV